MPKKDGQPGKSLYEQIQELQNKVTNYTSLTEEELGEVTVYSAFSRSENFQEKHSDKLEDPDNANLKRISERLGTLAAHYPKNSPELAALREHIPDIGKLRKEKMEALRADAGRTGMDKLLNDFLGSKKRAAKAELSRMHESRKSIDERDRSLNVKAPEHAGRGRNIFTSITNESALGSHNARHSVDEEFEHYGFPISFKTKNGVLSGAKVPLSGEPNGKVVLVFSGSGSPAENVIEGISDGYEGSGATVIVFNYRGFGQSKTLDSDGNQIGTPLSEQSMYEDGMEMYKYVRDVMGVSPENITLHGYSLGGAVASHVAANIAEQNKLKVEKGIAVPNSRKLGGIVLQSPIESMYAAAKDDTGSSIKAFFGSRGSGAYNTRENMQRLYRNDPNIPVAYISGTQEDKDHLSLDVTKLHLDIKAPFPNSSYSVEECGHDQTEEMLRGTSQHMILVQNGRNAQLDTASIQRQVEPQIQRQADRGSIGL